MKFRNRTAEIFVPDGIPVEKALKRTSWMGIGAHPDDLEILASPAIRNAFRSRKEWFCGVIVTDGRGSPRSGPFRKLTDERIRELRKEEQRKAAVVGKYGSVVFLDYRSAGIRRKNRACLEDLTRILKVASPRAVFTHDLTDKHPTHVAVALRVLEAIRKLPAPKRPRKLYGCEVWRSLDWLPDREKVLFDLSRGERLQRVLLGVHKSQIAGGKRYDLAVLGRQRANATFHRTHDVDTASAAAFAMDLTPLIRNPRLDPETFIAEKIERFEQEVRTSLKRYR